MHSVEGDAVDGMQHRSIQVPAHGHAHEGGPQNCLTHHPTDQTLKVPGDGYETGSATCRWHTHTHTDARAGLCCPSPGGVGLVLRINKGHYRRIDVLGKVISHGVDTIVDAELEDTHLVHQGYHISRNCVGEVGKRSPQRLVLVGRRWSLGLVLEVWIAPDNTLFHKRSVFSKSESNSLTPTMQMR